MSRPSTIVLHPGLKAAFVEWLDSRGLELALISNDETYIVTPNEETWSRVTDQHLATTKPVDGSKWDDKLNRPDPHAIYDERVTPIANVFRKRAEIKAAFGGNLHADAVETIAQLEVRLKSVARITHHIHHGDSVLYWFDCPRESCKTTEKLISDLAYFPEEGPEAPERAAKGSEVD